MLTGPSHILREPKMKKTCPHTKNVCPVLVNLENISGSVSISEEAVALKAIINRTNQLLMAGSCDGPFNDTYDKTDPLSNENVAHCSNNNVPEISDKVDQIAEEFVLHNSGIFDIENIGRSKV